jgi:hypothetical protein
VAGAQTSDSCSPANVPHAAAKLSILILSPQESAAHHPRLLPYSYSVLDMHAEAHTASRADYMPILGHMAGPTSLLSQDPVGISQHLLEQFAAPCWLGIGLSAAAMRTCSCRGQPSLHGHMRASCSCSSGLPCCKQLCWNCGTKRPNSGEPLKTCGRCHQARYCSVQCQRAHWRNGHKDFCTPTAAPLADVDAVNKI